MDSNQKIKILLTDEHKIMRDGLKALFNNHPDITIVGEADNPEDAKKFISQMQPDIITIGLNINNHDNIDIVRKFASEYPDIRIVAHSMYIEKTFVSEMLKAGTSAYVHKEDDFSELVKAIEATVHGNVYLCPRISRIVMSDYIQGITPKNSSQKISLSEREREVLQLLANGKSSKEIAYELHISTKTVDTHRRQIMNKVHLYSVPELTKYAIRCGLTSIN